MRTVILIPPSEGKAPSGTGKPLGHLPADVQFMYDRLRAYQGDHSALLGVKGKALEAAREANAGIVRSPTLPAVERYSGVVYDGIDYPSLSVRGREFFCRHVRIVSALFGLIEPQDRIPDYKLKIEKLDAAQYWRPLIARKLKGYFVIDLLPQAHQKAVEYEQGVRVDFIVTKKGRSIPAGHFGKLIKGQFVRWMCEEGVVDPNSFGKFRKDGFRFNGDHFVKVVEDID